MRAFMLKLSRLNFFGQAQFYFGHAQFYFEHAQFRIEQLLNFSAIQNYLEMALFHGKSVLKACSIFFALAQFEIEHAQNKIELVQKN